MSGECAVVGIGGGGDGGVAVGVEGRVQFASELTGLLPHFAQLGLVAFALVVGGRCGGLAQRFDAVLQTGVLRHEFAHPVLSFVEQSVRLPLFGL